MADGTSQAASKYALTVPELADLIGETPDDTVKGLRGMGLESAGKTAPVEPAAVRQLLEERGAPYRPQVIAVANLRGGIGKTTCTVTTASRAAQYGFKTCILDLDAQGSASLAFDQAPDDDDPIFYDVWQKPEEMVAGSLRKIEEYLYLLPSALENSLLDVTLVNPMLQKKAVRGVTEQILAAGFDLVMIDCPPSLSAVVISTICAVDTVVIPLGSDTFSFKGVDLTLREMGSICETFNLAVPDVKLLYSQHDRRLKLAAAAVERLEREYSEHFVPTIIPTSTELSRALARRETIFARRRTSPARTAYDAFVRHLLQLNDLR